jgi:hypothetical protein
VRTSYQLWAAIEVLFHASPLPRGEDDRPTVVTCDTAHGRLERRTLESSAALKDYLDWPGVNPVLRRTCRRVEVKTGCVSEEVTHGIASLSRQRGWKNVALQTTIGKAIYRLRKCTVEPMSQPFRNRRSIPGCLLAQTSVGLFSPANC